MAWLSLGSKSAPQVETIQVEQQSHRPVGVAPQESDIQNTLNQLSTDDEGQPRVHVLSAQSRNETNESVSQFVGQRPKNMYIIDGEKYANESIICTSDEKGKTCLKLKYNLIELFKQMQRLEYFCSLPNDIDATYFECRKIM